MVVVVAVEKMPLVLSLWWISGGIVLWVLVVALAWVM